MPVSGGRDHRAVGVHEEHVHAAELVDVLVLDRVEEDHLVAAVLGRLLLRQQAGRVVAAALGRARAAGRRRGCTPSDTQIVTGLTPPGSTRRRATR